MNCTAGTWATVESCCAAVWFLLNECHPAWCTPCLLTQQGNCAAFTHIPHVRNQKMQRKFLNISIIKKKNRNRTNHLYSWSSTRRLQAARAKLEAYDSKGVSAADKLYYLKMLVILLTVSEHPLVILSCSPSAQFHAQQHQTTVLKMKGNTDIFSDQRSIKLGSRQHARLKYYMKTRLCCITMAYCC